MRPAWRAQRRAVGRLEVGGGCDPLHWRYQPLRRFRGRTLRVHDGRRGCGELVWREPDNPEVKVKSTLKGGCRERAVQQAGWAPRQLDRLKRGFTLNTLFLYFLSRQGFFFFQGLFYEGLFYSIWRINLIKP